MKDLRSAVEDLLKAIEDNTENCYVDEYGEYRNIIIEQYIADEIDTLKSILESN